MKRLPVVAVLAFGGMLLAGCNPNKDQADPMADQDATTTPDVTSPTPGPETIPPATDVNPADQPPESPPVPEEPAPPPTG